MSKKLRLAITGGGSGGHILPLVSFLQTLDEKSQYWTAVESVYWFGEKRGMEYDFYTQYKESFQHFSPQFLAIRSGKYRRETIWISRRRNFRDICFLFPWGIVQSLRLLATKRIDVVFAKGGYVSLPVVIAARVLRRKVFVHESDTSAGITTRIAARFAKQSFTGFPDVLPRSITTGQILSNNLLNEPENIPFVLDPTKIILLVSGGSLGSLKLYRAVLQATATDPWFAEATQLIFINGQHLLRDEDLPEKHDHIIITDLIKDQATMGWLYRQADKAILRAGTTTLAEAKIFELPLVMVPLPITHDQETNAERYVTHHADTLLRQSEDDFIQKLYQDLAKTSKRSISVVDKKTKNKILAPKLTILDHVFSRESQ